MKKKLKKTGSILWLGLALTMSWLQAGFADDISFRVRVDRDKVTLGEVIQLMLAFDNASNVPAPELSTMDGFKGSYLGPVSRFSVVNGRQSASVIHRYILIPQKTGTFTLGPFTVQVNGKTLTAPALNVQVLAQASGPAPSGPGSPSQIQEKIFVTIDVSKKSAYINEKIDVTVKLCVNHMMIKDVHFPVLKADGFTVAEFGQPRQYQATINNQPYDVLEFQGQMAGTRTGSLPVGPVQIICSLVTSRKEASPFPQGMEGFFNADFFNNFLNTEVVPLDLRSPEVEVTIKPLPESGRPAEFSGAIGNFSLEAAATPQQVRVGDPVTLKMKVRGVGNFATVNKPVLSTEEGFKTYEPLVKEANGEKTFEQVLLPKSENVKEIPVIRFSFFNPDNQSFETISSGPIPLQVSGGPGVSGPARRFPAAPAPAEEKLGSDILYLKENLGCLRPEDSYWIDHILFWILMALPLAATGVVFAWSARARRIREDVRYARRLRAPRAARSGLALAKRLHAEGNNEEFYDRMHRLIREYFGDRLHLPSGSITFDTIDRAVAREDIPADILDTIKQVFDDCERARYAPASFDQAQRQKTWERCALLIDYFEKRKGHR